MARAYQILGYKTHHGLLEDVMATPWAGIERAAEATWPAVRERGAPPRGAFSREEWDGVWGDRCKLVLSERRSMGWCCSQVLCAWCFDCSCELVGVVFGGC